MKILESSPERLVIEEFPWQVAAWLMPPLLGVGWLGYWLTQHHLPTGLMLMGFPVLFGLILTFPVRRTRFVFSRSSGALEVQKASLWSRRTRTIPLEQIVEAEVESRPHHRATTGRG